MRFVSTALAVAVVLSLSGRSEAAPISAVIDFNAVPTGAISTLVVGDFTFTWVGFGDQQEVSTLGAANNALTDTTDGNLFGAEVIVSLTSGGPFTVTQFDIVSLATPAFGLVEFGGVEYRDPITQTVLRNDLANVTSFAINIIDVNHAFLLNLDIPHVLAVDNIHVSYDPEGPLPTAVPEPATLSLIGLGALGAAYRLRRRNQGVPSE